MDELHELCERIRYVVDGLDDEPRRDSYDRLSALVVLHTFLHRLAAEARPTSGEAA